MTLHQARNLKAHQIRTCRKYIRVAQSLGLTEASTSIRYWTQNSRNGGQRPFISSWKNASKEPKIAEIQISDR